MKQQYRIRNWSEYNAALKQRGSLTFWVSQAAVDQWLNTKPPGELGAPKTYSDIAIVERADDEKSVSIGGSSSQWVDGFPV